MNLRSRGLGPKPGKPIASPCCFLESVKGGLEGCGSTGVKVQSNPRKESPWPLMVSTAPQEAMHRILARVPNRIAASWKKCDSRCHGAVHNFATDLETYGPLNRGRIPAWKDAFDALFASALPTIKCR